LAGANLGGAENPHGAMESSLGGAQGLGEMANFQRSFF
jgi:hypothetical protein